MNSVFADTSYFVAMLQPRDQLHSKIVSLRNGRPIITTQWVLVETANFFASPNRRNDFLNLTHRLLARALIVPASDHWFLRGSALFETHRDKYWSLTDCISFAVMHEMGLTDALTADHHFEQAGFTALLK